jgi:hypothetical protein
MKTIRYRLFKTVRQWVPEQPLSGLTESISCLKQVSVFQIIR